MTRQEAAKGIKEKAKGLRLEEQVFLKNVMDSIKKRYKKIILWVTINLVGLGLVWGLLACPLLRFFHVCPMR